MNHITFPKSKIFWILKPTLTSRVSDKRLWTVSASLLISWIEEHIRSPEVGGRALLLYAGGAGSPWAGEQESPGKELPLCLPSLKLTNFPKLLLKRKKLCKGQIWEAQRITPKCFPPRESHENMGSRNKYSPLTIGLLWSLNKTMM